MKTLLASAMIAVSLSAVAGEITVVTSSSKTSPTTAMAMSYQKGLENSSFYQAENCQDGIRKFESSDNTVINFGTSLSTAALSKGQTCLPKITVNNLVFYAEQYYQICTKRGSGKNFQTPGAGLGMASVMPADKIVEDINKRNGTTLKGVPFSGSKAVLLQVMSGDLALGVIGQSTAMKHQAAGDIDCIASTDPTDANFIDKQIKMAYPHLKIPVVLLHNIKDPADLARAKEAVNSDSYQAFLDSGRFHKRTTAPTQELIDAVIKQVTDFHRAYGK